MRIEKIVLFFFAVICSFCIADAVFARDAREISAGIYERSITGTADGFTRLTVIDAPADAPGIRASAPGPSGVHTGSSIRYSLIDHTSEMFTVLSVLEKRVGDQRLLGKIRDKLPTLSEDRLRMIASLSERVAVDDHSAKTDIAFLLLTALIIFS
jgi:hypothetical protein